MLQLLPVERESIQFQLERLFSLSKKNIAGLTTDIIRLDNNTLFYRLIMECDNEYKLCGGEITLSDYMTETHLTLLEREIKDAQLKASCKKICND